MQQFDLIIVGGGLAGASLALALRNTPLSIALVEGRAPARPAGWDARIYAVSPANAEFLEEIGAWRHLDATRIEPIRSMAIAGDRGGALAFSAYESGVSELGWILESALMACEFWEGLKRQSNLTLFCPSRPAAMSVDVDRAVLTLEDGRVLNGRLLVGADGRDSWVRQAAGLAERTTHYGDKGLVANFETERPHTGVAYQWFREDGVLAYLPLPGNRISIVWSTPDEHADALLGLSPDALAARVAEAGGKVLGGLSLLTPAAAFPLRLIRVPKTVAARIALVGDAAHGIHPLSGHGINLGFQDARALAQLLQQAPAWQDIGSERFLSRYQRMRKEETLLLQQTTHALRGLFASRLPGAAFLRNAGLGLTDNLSFLKNALVRYALGYV